MSTVIFSKEEFEQALAGAVRSTVDGDRDRARITSLGIKWGEYVYGVMVTGTNKRIVIRSSVHSDGHSAEKGEDSIRMWVEYSYKGRWTALKGETRTHRTEGWENRMAEKLEGLFQLALIDSQRGQKPPTKGELTGSKLAALGLDTGSQADAPRDEISEPESPQCPKCGSEMKLRTARRGPNAGNQFWGCSQYPRCWGTRDVEVSEPEPEPIKREFTPSEYQEACREFLVNGEGNGVIEAVAGSGKTTTIVWLLEFTPKDLDVAFVAFNRHIAKELKKRAPQRVTVSTLHSLGFGNVQDAFGRVKVEPRKVYHIVRDIAERMESQSDYELVRLNEAAIVRLVSLCKATLNQPSEGVLEYLCDRYGIETNGAAEIVYGVTRRAFTQSNAQTHIIDYDDMIYFPASGKVACKRFDILFVDECQDLNKAQIELALRSVKEGGRIIAVGDRNQCHPAGTMIAVCPEQLSGTVQYRAIEDIREGDTLIGYNSRKSYFPGTRTQGKRVLQMASRDYYGEIIQIDAGGNKVECTPNHRWLTRFSRGASTMYAVYLMTKLNESDGRIWARVGIIKFSLEAGNGVATRARQEKADKAWILKVCDTKENATAWESATQAHFGIPGLVFKNRGTQFITQENIDRAYTLYQTQFYPHRVKRCLEFFGRDLAHPIWEQRPDNSHIGVYSFITEACNLIEDVMEVRTFDGDRRGGKWTPIENITCRMADGEKVYSLKVEPMGDSRRLYVADGLVTHNSIYGFRGADTEAIPNLIEAIGATVLPLTITYRCPKSHVALAQGLVPEIQAAEWAEEGIIEYNLPRRRMLEEAKDGDLVLCRCNAPLVRPAFSLIREGKKAVILGRDIGKGLVVLLKKVEKKYQVHQLDDILFYLEEYSSGELRKLYARKKATRAQILEDKVETISALAEGCDTMRELESKIDKVFADDAVGVTFSSVHKAKGGEAERVWILEPGLMPHPKASEGWEMVQERNIQYVAYTRSKKALYFVS